MLDRLKTLDTQDAFTATLRTPDYGYLCARRLPDGCYIGLQRLMFTIALCVGITEGTPFERRYCYENAGDAIHEFEFMTHQDHEPQGWVARRGVGCATS